MDSALLWRITHINALLQQAVLNVVIGNADAHGKNLGLLHHRSGTVALAPIYDVMATTHYPGVDQTLGMYVGAVRQVGEVRLADLAAEATSWGMPEARALKAIGEVVERVPGAVTLAARAVPGLPPAIAELALHRSEALLGSKKSPATFSLPTPGATRRSSRSGSSSRW